MHKELSFSGSKLHLIKHSTHFNMFIIIHINNTVAWVITQEYLSSNEAPHNQLCPCNFPPNHRPVCSLISQQHCHPQDGHDSPRKRKLAGSHIAKDMSKLSQAKAMFGFIRLPRGWKGLFAKLVRSTIKPWTPTRDLTWLFQHVHTQHKESSPSLLYSPLGYAFPYSAIQDVK